MRNKRILLTGGAGFIGSSLCKVLYKNNEILIYDNLKRNSIQNTSLLDEENVNLVKGDILDFNNLNKTVNDFKPNVVIHLAAIAGIDTVIKAPVSTMKVNMVGTSNILEAVKEYSAYIDRFIDFSTSEVFGSYAYKVDEKCTTNLEPVGEARWTYSVSKLAAEHLTHSYHKQYGLKTVTIRPFNIYGPGQVGEGAIHEFVMRAIKNEQIKIHGDGEQIRSWCYIDDFVDGVKLCLENEEAIGNSFNIGNPKGTITIEMLARLIKDISGSKSEIVYVPKNYEDVELRVPSINKAVKILGFKPKYNLTSGLNITIEWYRSNIK